MTTQERREILAAILLTILAMAAGPGVAAEQPLRGVVEAELLIVHGPGLLTVRVRPWPGMAFNVLVGLDGADPSAATANSRELVTGAVLADRPAEHGPAIVLLHDVRVVTGSRVLARVTTLAGRDLATATRQYREP